MKTFAVSTSPGPGMSVADACPRAGAAPPDLTAHCRQKPCCAGAVPVLSPRSDVLQPGPALFFTRQKKESVWDRH